MFSRDKFILETLCFLHQAGNSKIDSAVLDLRDMALRHARNVAQRGEEVDLAEAYTKEQGLFREVGSAAPEHWPTS